MVQRYRTDTPTVTLVFHHGSPGEQKTILFGEIF